MESRSSIQSSDGVVIAISWALFGIAFGLTQGYLGFHGFVVSVCIAFGACALLLVVASLTSRRHVRWVCLIFAGAAIAAFLELTRGSTTLWYVAVGVGAAAVLFLAAAAIRRRFNWWGR